MLLGLIHFIVNTFQFHVSKVIQCIVNHSWERGMQCMDRAACARLWGLHRYGSCLGIVRQVLQAGLLTKEFAGPCSLASEYDVCKHNYTGSQQSIRLQHSRGQHTTKLLLLANLSATHFHPQVPVGGRVGVPSSFHSLIHSFIFYARLIQFRVTGVSFLRLNHLESGNKISAVGQRYSQGWPVAQAVQANATGAVHPGGATNAI